MAKKNDTITVPSVLAFERKIQPSAGVLSGTTWDERINKFTPLHLLEKSVRGTISNRLKKASAGDPAKLNTEVEKANLQTVDDCALGSNQDTLNVNFTVKFLSGVENPSSCNSDEFRRIYGDAVKAYIEKDGFVELGKRYATNIANARFLWRNRVGASIIEVVVRTKFAEREKTWTFDAKTIGVRDFNTKNPDVLDLASEIASALSGKTDFLLLEIDAYSLLGAGQDVFPSEELVLDKGNSKSKKSKILYQIEGVAGLHSQKIGNALRTIDTWYPEYAEANIGPIAAEIYGSVTTAENRGNGAQAK